MQNAETIYHYAQFRDPQQQRMVIFVLDEEASATDKKQHAQCLAYVDDRLMVVY